MFGFYRFFHRLIRPGKVTLFLVICLFVQTIFLNQNHKLNTKLALIHHENQNKEHIAKLYLEYCISRVVDRKKCLFSKPFFILTEKKSDIENTNKDFSIILNDLGKEYKQTDHFLSFYRKLLFEDDEIKKLNSYPEFLTLRNQTYSEIKKIHQQYGKVSSLNFSFLSVLRSFFSAESWSKFFYALFIYLFFSRGVELILGKRLFFFSLFLGSFAAVYMSLLNLSGSTEIISLELVIPSFILGVLLGMGKKVQFYISSRWNLPLRGVILILWLIQELLLHLYYPLTTTHLVHFLSLVLGATFGMILYAKNNLPFGFLSAHVHKYWKEVRSHPNLESMLNIGIHILEENPDNYTVKNDMLIAILDAQLKSENQVVYWNILEIILADLISIYCLQDSKKGLVLKILDLVPEMIPLYPYLGKMRMKKYKALIELANTEKDFLLVIKLLESVFICHRRARRIYAPNSAELNHLALERIQLKDDEHKNSYRKYVLNSKSLELQDLLMPYLRN